MGKLETTSRFALIVVFSGAIVLIGAEQLRRKTLHNRATREQQQQMAEALKQGQVDFRGPDWVAKVKKPEGQGEVESATRARLGQELTEKDKEKMDPTDLRSLVNRLIK